ncbi:MAG TPA: hypothetical protein VLH37_04790 [Bacteroidales bacterium]|nr:hypothetical protein [Bacteroidales bacterium]
MRKIKTSLFLLPFVLFCLEIKAIPTEVFVRNQNIFAVLADGSEKQLTTDGSDSHPIIIPGRDHVVFVRDEVVRTTKGSYTRKKIMMVDVSNLNLRVITDEKPYADGLDNTYEILNVISPTLSPDNRYLYFITEKYATSNQLVKVHLQSGEWTELFAAETFELIRNGEHTGRFLISRSEIGDRGRDLYFRLVDERGNTMKRFESEESLMHFRREIQ